MLDARPRCSSVLPAWLVLVLCFAKPVVAMARRLQALLRTQPSTARSRKKEQRPVCCAWAGEGLLDRDTHAVSGIRDIELPGSFRKLPRYTHPVEMYPTPDPSLPSGAHTCKKIHWLAKLSAATLLARDGTWQRAWVGRGVGPFRRGEVQLGG